MKIKPVARFDAQQDATVRTNLASLDPQPCILTQAMRAWPAMGTWTLPALATRFGDDFGVVWMAFHAASVRKTTRLATFIQHLGAPVGDIPGFWIDENDRPMAVDPLVDDRTTWSFVWNAFELHEDLWREIEPYPSCVPNLTMQLSLNVRRAIEAMTRIRQHEVYLSRQGVITPLHRDHHATFGSIAQFDGRKHVVLIAPDDYAKVPGAQFDPERPDYAAFPQMRGVNALETVLEPGELLIIPPNWWHYTRSVEHSLILSHNFFAEGNFAAYFHQLLEDLARAPDAQALQARIGKRLGLGAGAA